MKEYLEELNSHWFNEKDPDLEKLENLKIKMTPCWIDEVSLKPFSLNFVIGPRRVGKTTGLKFLIKKLLNQEEKEKIVYLNCDLIPDLNFFQKVLKYISENNFRFIFIDEITSVEKWWKPLKGFVDAGKFKKAVITVSGSMSLRIKKEAELFPGRKGYGKTIEVLPLSFFKLSSIFKAEKVSEKRKVFENYLKFGGFLGAWNFSRQFYQEIIESFESEVLKTGLSVKTCFEIISSLLKFVPSPVSYQTIAKQIEIDYKTVRHYLETLENMFLIKIVNWKGEGKISFRKERKIFFRDPFLLHSFSYWTGVKFLESCLYEHIVQEHLFRKYGEVYYYRNRYEIDCIAKDLKIEVKAGKPHRKYPKGVKILDEDNIAEFLINLFKYEKREPKL